MLGSLITAGHWTDRLLETASYEGLFNNRDIDTVVVLDVLGWRHLIRKPATLWDAFTQLIVDPITANAQGRFNAFMLKNEIRKLKADPEGLTLTHISLD